VKLHAHISLFVSVCALAGCGWRLQGSSHISETASITYVDARDTYTDFHRALVRTLSSSGARVVADSGEAKAIVHVRKDESGQRVLSVSARNTPEEYEVYYKIEYSVEAGGTEVIGPQILELTREYSYDEGAVLAKQREQTILRDALARDLAALVVRRLGAL
jgi:LPS-assembly lipoprotein